MMRTILVLTCCLALTGVVCAKEEDNDKEKGKGKKKVQTTQQAVTTTGQSAGGPGQGKKYQTLSNASNTSQLQKQKLSTPTNVRKDAKTDPGDDDDLLSGGETAALLAKKQKLSTPSNFRRAGATSVDPTNPNTPGGKAKKFKAGSELAAQGNVPAVQSGAQLQGDGSVKKGKFKAGSELAAQSNVGVENPTTSAALQTSGKPWKVQKFTLQKNTAITPVRFGASTRIVGAQNWQGNDYNAFRIYTSQRRDRNWWSQNHSRFILSSGGYYYWNSGYWYPAWGYDPSFEFYAYDGPIYGYNNLPPDQVIANVQAVLQRQGYYHGFVDGMLGPLTRAALANYQRDRGLYITSAIDRPTLYALGMS